jgi:hypothetical protein
VAGEAETPYCVPVEFDPYFILLKVAKNARGEKSEARYDVTCVVALDVVVTSWL